MKPILHLKSKRYLVGAAATLALFASSSTAFQTKVSASTAASTASVPSGYTWVSASGAVCSGGVTTGATYLGLIQAELGDISALPPAAQTFLAHIYPGTTCRTVFGGRHPIVSAQGVDPSGSYCTNNCVTSDCGSTGYSGCYNAQTIINVTYNFNLTLSYTGEDILVLTAQDGFGNWSNTSGNFHNDHGNSWGMQYTQYKFSGTYDQTWADQFGSGEYGWGSFSDPKGSVDNLAAEQVHIGGIGTDAQPNGGSDTLCWYTDYQADDASVIGGGFCSNP